MKSRMRLPAHQLAASLVAVFALSSAAVPTAAHAGGAAVDRLRLTGTWDRYPGPGGKLDPRFTSAPPAPPPPLKPKYMTEWEARQKAAHEADLRGQPLYSGYAQCLPDGMPAMMMGMFPMEIFQRPEQINITQEAFTQLRRIYMNEKMPPLDSFEPGFYGRSVGHWEGDTLVVETMGIKPNIEFRWTPHSENMKITERIHLMAPDYLRDDITVTDDYLEKPWTYSYSFKRMKGYKMQEYVCEDNREYVDENGKQKLRLPGEQ